MLEIWLSDDNAIVREKFRRGVVGAMTPILTSIIRQGVTEGTFTVDLARSTRRGSSSRSCWAPTSTRASCSSATTRATIPFEVVEAALNAYPEAMERILGAAAGSLRWWPDDRLLHRMVRLTSMHARKERPA